MRNHRMLAKLVAVIAVLVAIGFFGPCKKLMEQWRKSQPPAPYRFVSLRNLSDEQIARFMSGDQATSSFHEPGAPDSHFPELLWGTDPKKAALAFAEANRSPEHRKTHVLSMNGSPSLKAPDAGWIVFDPGSASCPLSSSGTTILTVLRFGVDRPFLFHSATYTGGVVGQNRYVDGTSHWQQLIALTPDEARFLAHTIYWLEHIQSEDVRNLKRGIGMIKFSSMSSSRISSTADGFGRLDWWVGKGPPRRIEETMWADDSIADRWSGEYDNEVGLNLSSFLLTEALPKHLGTRWQAGPSHSPAPKNPMLAERLDSRENPVVQENMTRVILAALSRHESDPFPADAIIAIAECAGNQGLEDTLQALENLAATLPPPSADETEFTALDEKFRFVYPAPKDPAERVKWERHQSLETSLEHDFSTQVRRPLARAIRQLHALGKPDPLREMAQVNDESAMWALRQLHRIQPEFYVESLVQRFITDHEWSRSTIFNTLASLDPPAARRLRDSLHAKDQADLLFDIIDFELTDDPSRAQARIPTLFDLAETSTETTSKEGFPVASKRGPAIQCLARMKLAPKDEERFERILLKELLTPTHDERIGKPDIGDAAKAVKTRPDPDKFWDALATAFAAETGYTEFNSLLEALAALALAKPEPHLSQLTELLRPRLSDHTAHIKSVCEAALALDLRGLAPEIGRFATSGPAVPDGETGLPCKNSPDDPCLHRYHCARHVSAVWLESDADTRARMWAAMLLDSPYDFVGTETIPSSLRGRCHSAISAAKPNIRKHLIERLRSNSRFPEELSQWLGTLP